MAIEDELYEAFKSAVGADREKIESQLNSEFIRHAGKVAAIKEVYDATFPRDAATAVWEALPTFEGRNDSSFSTWSHAVILNQLKMWFRSHKIERKYFVQSSVVFDERHIEPEAKFDPMPKIALDQARKHLDDDEAELYDDVLRGLKTPEIAQKYQISEDAAETRVRRLIEKVQKKCAKADGK